MAGNAGINLSEFAREHKNDEFCATCAIVPSAKNIEKDVKSGILGGFNSELALGTMAQVAQTNGKTSNGYTFSDKLEAYNLDHILHTILDLHHSDAAKCDAMTLIAFRCLSTWHENFIYKCYRGRNSVTMMFINQKYNRYEL